MKMTVMMKKKAKSGSGEKFKWENLIAANFPDDENSQQTLIKFDLSEWGRQLDGETY